MIIVLTQINLIGMRTSANQSVKRVSNVEMESVQGISAGKRSGRGATGTSSIMMSNILFVIYVGSTDQFSTVSKKQSVTPAPQRPSSKIRKVNYEKPEERLERQAKYRMQEYANNTIKMSKI
jgi:ribosomal protein L15